MTKAIYLCSTEPYSGKSIIALGLINLLASKAEKIAYLKPVISAENSEKDGRLDTILSYFKLDMPYEDMFVFSQREAINFINEGKESYLLDSVIDRFKQLQDKNDFVVVEGTDFLGSSANLQFNGNISIAKNLGIPVAIILNGKDKSIQEVLDNAVSTTKSFVDEGVQILSLIVNKLDSGKLEELNGLLSTTIPPSVLISVIPANGDLGNPTLKEIAMSLEAEVIFGHHLLYNQVDVSIVGAMQLHNSLARLKRNTLIVTPGDRGDIVIGALQANISKNYPKVSGIVLTGGLHLEPTIIKLIEGLETVVPILQVKTGTFETVTRIANTQSRICAEDREKITLAINTFEQYVNIDLLAERIASFHSKSITPRMFQYQIVKRAKAFKKHIVLPEGEDDRVLQAADALIKQNIVDLSIIGNKISIASAIHRLNLSLDVEKIQIIDPATSEHFQDYANTLYELRKNKNVSIEMARDLMLDVSYFGTMMVYKGAADGMVSGAQHTTQHTIRPALQFIKTKANVSTVSSVFFMCLPNRVCVFGDCAVIPKPTTMQLADIAISSAETSLMFGIEPKIAMLSYSSGNSGEGMEVESVREATKIVKGRRPDLRVEGPIQYDAAVDYGVGKKKMPNSEVAGQASVLIFPDLNTGNNTYKAVQRETGALAIGPILQGLNKPVNDLSRGCTVDDIFNTVVITAIQAQQL